MPGHDPAQGTAAPADPVIDPARLVLVDEPQRLVREALVAAIDAAPGLAALDAAATAASGVTMADAAVIAARSLRYGGHHLLDRVGDDRGPSPIVIVAEHGPVTPSLDRRGLVVVSRETPIGLVVDCLRAGRDDLRDLPAWGAWSSADDLLTTRERQVLGLLASGLSPAEVARGLAITTYTVRDHTKAIRAKLEQPTILAAVLEAIRRGLLDPGGPGRSPALGSAAAGRCGPQ